MARYLDEGFWRSPDPQGVRRAGTYHRTLSTYPNALVRHRFLIEEAVEPAAADEYARQEPVYARVPIFFAFRARREG